MLPFQPTDIYRACSYTGRYISSLELCWPFHHSQANHFSCLPYTCAVRLSNPTTSYPELTLPTLCVHLHKFLDYFVQSNAEACHGEGLEMNITVACVGSYLHVCPPLPLWYWHLVGCMCSLISICLLAKHFAVCQLPGFFPSLGCFTAY